MDSEHSYVFTQKVNAMIFFLDSVTPKNQDLYVKLVESLYSFGSIYGDISNPVIKERKKV